MLLKICHARACFLSLFLKCSGGPVLSPPSDVVPKLRLMPLGCTRSRCPVSNDVGFASSNSVGTKSALQRPERQRRDYLVSFPDVLQNLSLKSESCRSEKNRNKNFVVRPMYGFF